MLFAITDGLLFLCCLAVVLGCIATVAICGGGLGVFQFRTLSRSAKLKVLKGDFLNALKDYDKLIALAPKNAVLHRLRGSAKRALQQYDAAITDFDQAIALKPDFANAYCERASTSESAGNAISKVPHRRFCAKRSDSTHLIRMRFSSAAR